MRRNVIDHVVKGLFGSVLLLILLSVSGNVGAQSGDVPADASGTTEASAATPLTTAFTYQGQLKNGGKAVNGSCDMVFRLYDALMGGGLIGNPITAIVPVTSGLFTAGLDFGAAFNGNTRWLDMQVRCPSGSGAFTQLAPRQQLTAAPYALFSTAPWVTSGSSLTYNAGNVGIGTMSPGAGITLDVNGATRVTPGGTGGEIALAAPNGETGLTIKGATSRADVRFDGTSLKLLAGTGTGPPASNSGIIVNSSGNVGIGTMSPSAGIKLEVNGATRVTPGGTGGEIVFAAPSGETGMTIKGANRADVRFDGATLKLVAGTGGGPPASSSGVAIATSGNVGIGTTTPAHRLSIAGGPAWTSNGWAGAVELSNASAIGWQANSGGQRFGIGQTNGGLAFFRTASDPGTTASPATYDMFINDAGNIGIGTTAPVAKLDVRTQDLIQDALRVEGYHGTVGLRVTWNGYVEVNFSNAYVSHVCAGPSGILASCGSAAEYVPTIDSGSGFPETADLVSIAPSLKNPYGDDHAPFVVTRSTQSCDDNLLGFIVNPESGADGKKLNDHYLPLAIYGYFPAKVTMENGLIKRGDPITSSSKPGYGMKATQACKIIGYALEDADQEGTIQVFANHGENAAPEVAALRTQVQELGDQNAALHARFNALEQKISELTK